MPVTVSVAVEAPRHASLSALLDYTSEHLLIPGMLLRVPLGRREVPALYTRARTHWAARTVLPEPPHGAPAHADRAPSQSAASPRKAYSQRALMGDEEESVP